ncbi:endopeptidase La [bacterium]|nr:endopeptidase La [bacterium]
MKKGAKAGTELMDLPCLPLRDVVIFPGMSVPLFVGRSGSIAAVEASEGPGKAPRQVVAVAQKDPSTKDPAKRELYDVGCIAVIKQVVRMPDATLKIVVEGKSRVRIDSLNRTRECLMALVQPVESPVDVESDLSGLMRNVSHRFEEYVRLGQKIPQESAMAVLNLADAARLSDSVAAQIFAPPAVKQSLLEEFSPEKRLYRLSEILEREIDIAKLENKIRSQVRKQMDVNQREYYLAEQMKAIQKEMGRPDSREDFDALREAIEKAGMPPEVKEKADKELARLEKMPPLTPETTVARNYIGWLTELPWTRKTEDQIDVRKAQKILDEDHYGLDKPKERILEYLAVCKLAEQIKGPILCLVGPPGVGKTSLGKSIARAMSREFVRMSLGGVRDEAEIRGHRRTYVGSMPGRILQLLAKAKVRNPVFLLDEVDKMSVDFRGDPSSALLEVLDPEQNRHFVDHFLEVGFDLSECLFITTANVRFAIPPPLLDRMEVIELSGYTQPEKIQIAKSFLVPKQTAENGLSARPVKLSDDVIGTIIRRYTNEAGVRDLERHIGKIFRRAARAVAEGKRAKLAIRESDLEKILGVPQVHEKRTLLSARSESGAAAGLAWTERGGDVLLVEVSRIPGRGQLILTGSLGDVMKESGMAALTFARKIAGRLGVGPELFRKSDFHIHVAEGAIPKDGPSAGITIASALLSAILSEHIPKDLAMTGEITLSGRILPVGGLRSKLLAAQRYGIRRVVLPRENEPQIREIPSHEIAQLKLDYVDRMEDLIPILFPKCRLHRSDLTAEPATRRSAQSLPASMPAAH